MYMQVLKLFQKNIVLIALVNARIISDFDVILANKASFKYYIININSSSFHALVYVIIWICFLSVCGNILFEDNETLLSSSPKLNVDRG